MARIGANTCGVCGKDVSKYRCPACGILYCSLACNKIHKSGSNGRPPCSGKRARPGNETATENLKRQREGVGGDENKENGDFPTPSAPCVRKPRDQWRGGKIEENGEEEWQMSSDQKARISGCKWLKSALRDPKLQGLLREIDSTEDRETSLAFHRTNQQFGEFVDKLLLEIEEYREGGPDEPELVANEP